MIDKQYELAFSETCQDYQRLQKFPRLISGLREMSLLKLIEINPLKNKIALAQREQNT